MLQWHCVLLYKHRLISSSFQTGGRLSVKNCTPLAGGSAGLIIHHSHLVTGFLVPPTASLDQPKKKKNCTKLQVSSRDQKKQCLRQERAFVSFPLEDAGRRIGQGQDPRRLLKHQPSGLHRLKMSGGDVAGSEWGSLRSATPPTTTCNSVAPHQPGIREDLLLEGSRLFLPPGAAIIFIFR